MLCSPVLKKHGHSAASPGKDHKDDRDIIQGASERQEKLSLVKRKVEGVCGVRSYEGVWEVRSYQRAYKYVVGGSKDNGVRLFPVAPRDSTNGNAHKLQHRKTKPNYREPGFVGERWSGHCHK